MSHTDETVQQWLERILGHEGGYVNDPTDPGGETKWGISKRSYPDLNIKTLTIDKAAGIYRRDFLEPLKADNYHDGVAFQLLDFAVNSGTHRAVIALQKVIGTEPDGIIGPVTLAQLRAYSESDLIMLIIAERLDFMTRLKNWSHHGKGWIRRVADNLRYGALDS